jgi:hypothetical protein
MSGPDLTTLAAPIRSTIDFAFGPPQDILHSEFPEKIVLAFYQSLDSSRENQIETDSREFLAPGRPAYQNYDPNNLGYFFGNQSGDQVSASLVQNLSVTKLQYYPMVEELTQATPTPMSPANLPTPVRGEIIRRGRVDIDLVGEQLPFVSTAYEVIFAQGRWWISGRLR